MEKTRPGRMEKAFFVWFLFLAAGNVLSIFGFCPMFARFQEMVVHGKSYEFFLSACRATWDTRLFTWRYVAATGAALYVAYTLWTQPERGMILAQWYLLIGVLLRFTFNVFPRTGPDCGLFPLPPGTSENPPVYMLPVSLGVWTGTVQIFVLTFASVYRVRKPKPSLPTINPAET